MSQSDRGLRRLAAGTLLVAFQGTTAPDWVLRELEHGLGGVTLFGFNVADADQLLDAHRPAAREAGEPVISLDEEGGDVTRLAYHVGSPYPGNAALGAVDDVELTRRVYRAIGAELAALRRQPGHGARRRRQHRGRQPGDRHPLVRRRTPRWSPGTPSPPSRACSRRAWPPASSTSPATAPPASGLPPGRSRSSTPRSELLRERELVPFRAAIEAGTRSIMTAHVAVPVADRRRRPPRCPPPRSPGCSGASSATTAWSSPTRWTCRRSPTASAWPAAPCCPWPPGPTCSAWARCPPTTTSGRSSPRSSPRWTTAGCRCPGWRQAADRVAALRAWFGSRTHRARPSRTGSACTPPAARSSSPARPRPLVEPLVIEVDTPPTIAVGDVPWGVGPWLPRGRDPPGRSRPTARRARPAGQGHGPVAGGRRQGRAPQRRPAGSWSRRWWRPAPTRR